MRISDWSSDVCASDLTLDVLADIRPDVQDHRDSMMLQHAHQRAGVLRGQSRVGHDVSRIRWRFLAAENTGRPSRRPRSEERRVGQEWGSTCRSRWSPSHSKKNKQTITDE